MSLCCVCKLRKSPGDRVKSRGGLGELDKATIAPGEKQHFDPNFPDETDPAATSSREHVGNNWVSTKDRTSVSEMRINYKLFDCLKREFTDPGYICKDCHELLEQIDALQYQANELIRELRGRIDYNLEESLQLESTFNPVGSGNKRTASEHFTPTRGGGTSSYSKRLKTEPNFEVDVHEDSLDFIDDGGDPDFVPAPVRPSNLRPRITAPIKLEEYQQSSTPTSVQRPPKPTIRTTKDPNKRQILFKNEFWDKVNNEEYVRATLSKKNFEYEVQIIDTVSGHQHLIYDGNIWHQSVFKEFATGKYVMKWMCGKGHNNSYQCKAMVATLADHSAVIVESKYMEHNHELDPEEVQDALMRNSSREVTLNHPEMTPIRVFKTVMMMNPECTTMTDKKQKAFLRYIARVQDKHGIPRKPRECKPGHVKRVRKKPLDKWKKTPSQLKAEAEEAEAAAVMAAEAEASSGGVPEPGEVVEGEMIGVEPDGEEASGQVQHIIIQPGSAAGVIVQQPNKTYQIQYTTK